MIFTGLSSECQSQYKVKISAMLPIVSRARPFRETMLPKIMLLGKGSSNAVWRGRGFVSIIKSSAK